MEELRRALRLYNKYRGKEAKAKVVDQDRNAVTVEIRGSFCKTCGVYDWLEDLVYVARDVGLELELVDAEEKTEDRWVAIYRIKK